MIEGSSPPAPNTSSMTAIPRHHPGAILVASFAILIAGCAHSPPAVPLRLDSIGQEEVEVDPHGGADHGGELHPGKGSHDLGVFVGGSSDLEGGNGGVLGLDYGYRVTDHLGIGLFAEGVAGLNRSFATGVQGYWATPVDILLFVGTGYERHDADWEPIYRLGIEYEIITPSGWVFAPSVFYDFGETTDLVVYGLTIARFL